MSLIAFAAALQLVAAPAAPVAPVSPSAWQSTTTAEGRWRYRPILGGSEAVWSDIAGTPQLALRCTLALRQMAISRAGGGVPLTIFTTGAQRALTNATLSAFDPLLDQIAFSRGRIAFAATGAPLLVVPSWAEPARTIEDCRK